MAGSTLRWPEWLDPRNFDPRRAADRLQGVWQTAVRWFDEVTEATIGWSFPPPQRAMTEAEWEPDQPDAYCHRCGGSVGPGEANESGCADCRQRRPLADAVVRLGVYQGHLREWVGAVKYRGWHQMGDLLGRRLGEAVVDAEIVRPAQAVVVPMPMPWQRRLYRGIDHAAVIADAVAKVVGAPTANVLAKTNGPPQVGLAPSEREARARRALRIRHSRLLGPWDLNNLEVLLVDDVRTTGASLRAAIRLLRRLRPARVAVAVVAVAEPPNRRSAAVADRTAEISSVRLPRP